MPTRLTYDQLFRLSEPKRINRSATVKGPPLQIDPYRDTEFYSFNFKSHPSTTGLRHRGYIKFFRPRNNRPVPLEHLQCMVDCTCPDYRYRWAWTNKQRNSGSVGPRSLNQALNRAPRITNPKGLPGLCKHVLAARHYIYGVLSKFTGSGVGTNYAFDKLLRYATKRWDDFPGAMAAAKARDFALRQRAQLRNVAGPLPPEPEPAGLVLPEPPEDVMQPGNQPEAPPLPPEYELPDADSYTNPEDEAKTKGRVETGGFPTVAQRNAARYGESRPVVSANGITSMKDLKNAIRIVEELIDDGPETYDTPPPSAPPEGDFAAPDLPPSEPPASDSALGADTKGAAVIDLLTDIRDVLVQLAGAEGAEGELPPEGGELPPEGGEAEGGAAIPSEGELAVKDELLGDEGLPEPEGDLPDEGGAEGEEGESSEDDEANETEDED